MRLNRVSSRNSSKAASLRSISGVVVSAIDEVMSVDTTDEQATDANAVGVTELGTVTGAHGVVTRTMQQVLLHQLHAKHQPTDNLCYARYKIQAT